MTATCVDVHFPYPVPVDYTGAVVNFTNMQDPPPGAAPASAASSSVSCGTTVQVRAGDTPLRHCRPVRHVGQRLGFGQRLANPNHIRAGQTLCVQ